MSRIPWTLYDPIENESYSLPVNPNAESGSSVGIIKNINYSVSINDHQFIHSNSDEIKKYNFSGSIYTQSEYNNLIYWFNKNNFIQLSDDIGRVFEIYFLSFKIERKRSARFPWKHTYTAEAIIRNSNG